MARVERRYTIQTCDPSVSRTAVRWGPQFSSSAPPRSPAPSFEHPPVLPSLLRRRVSRTCAWERRNFSLRPAGRCKGEEAAEGRKGEGGAGNGSGRASVHDTNLRSVSEQNRCQVGPTILFECPAQIPRSFLRSSSLWARHSAETSELNVRLGAAEFFPEASRQMQG